MKFIWFLCSCCPFVWFVFAVDGMSGSVPTMALLIPSNCYFAVEAALPRGFRIVGKHSCCCSLFVFLAALCAPFARGVSSDVWWSVGKGMRTLVTTLVCGGVLGAELSICDNDPNEFVGECGCFIVTFSQLLLSAMPKVSLCSFSWLISKGPISTVPNPLLVEWDHQEKCLRIVLHCLVRMGCCHSLCYHLGLPRESGCSACSWHCFDAYLGLMRLLWWCCRCQ